MTNRILMNLLLGALVTLGGCAMNLRLLEDGKVHQGKFNPASRTMEATIDGVFYSGPISQGVGVGFGQTFYNGKVGFGTTTVASGQWQGILTNQAGQVIQCTFQAALGQGQGACEGLDGRRYLLVIGPMPGDPPAADACPPGQRRASGACIS